MSGSPTADNVRWLVADLVERTVGLTEAVVVSPDGLPLAMSGGLDRATGDRFAAVASGMIGLAHGAAGRFGGGAVLEVMIEMEHGFLFMTGIADGSCLAVSTTATADVGLVGYELAVAADRIGALLTPALRLELQRSLPQGEPGIR
jgi:predicted regulator of Ras-like GTPase activity (Roadblock/LC7/MglB family)